MCQLYVNQRRMRTFWFKNRHLISVCHIRLASNGGIRTFRFKNLPWMRPGIKCIECMFSIWVMNKRSGPMRTHVQLNNSLSRVIPRYLMVSFAISRSLLRTHNIYRYREVSRTIPTVTRYLSFSQGMISPSNYHGISPSLMVRFVISPCLSLYRGAFRTAIVSDGISLYLIVSNGIFRYLTLFHALSRYRAISRYQSLSHCIPRYSSFSHGVSRCFSVSLAISRETLR